MWFLAIVECLYPLSSPLERCCSVAPNEKPEMVGRNATVLVVSQLLRQYSCTQVVVIVAVMSNNMTILQTT